MKKVICGSGQQQLLMTLKTRYEYESQKIPEPEEQLVLVFPGPNNNQTSVAVEVPLPDCSEIPRARRAGWLIVSLKPAAHIQEVSATLSGNNSPCFGRPMERDLPFCPASLAGFPAAVTYNYQLFAPAASM
ncbi:hypothetical protein BaRGS_00002180 [Batillaria attramentaria]|uniref:Uncharacterized protein n=1 Tax=Batillaria attramentaria TaxID=370345 RepID=A0ABD0M473_9CAEN